MPTVGTIVVLAIVLIVAGFALYSVIKRRKSGKCDCGCSGCPNASSCNRADK